MNLTQRELAALAKVSTPTISRFEQADKDIQLSSASAILDILGMTDKRMLTFPDREYSYDSGAGVTFWGQDGTTRVRCRISREALDDHFSEGDRLRPEAAFKKHREEIEALARRKYLVGQKESDGTVLIKTQEIVD
jgi:transcriptional regulator with XRE-family HTH domain